MSKGGRRVRIFSALEVANICGVVNQTAINWIRNGHLKAFTTPGGQYRVYAKDLAAFLDKRGMGTSGEVLQVMMEDADWNTILIAAEQSLNESLKGKMGKLFPEFIFIQAFDWFEIGRKITGEKPGFILLDAELSGVDIAKFISTVKDDLSFGKPYVLLMTNSQRTDGSYPYMEGVVSGHGRADLILSRPPDMDKLEAAIRGLEKQLDMAVIA